MKNPSVHHLHRRGKIIRRRGFAIVVVVALMALLMLLALAFLLTSSTNRNSGNSDVSLRQAESVAQVAQQTIAVDLLEEMRAGSTTNDKTPDGKNSYSIDNVKAMVPSRAVKAGIAADTKLARLVKQSAAGVKFYNIQGVSTAGSTRASDISTGKAAVDGRRVAEIRWSAPQLLEDGAALTASQVPDWVYVTREGKNPAAFSAANSKSLDTGGKPNPAYVVGRYAYQVYDVSGLLDINVAGHGSSAPAINVSRKGSLVWADLTALPGAGGSISKISDWRHSGTWSDALADLVQKWGEPYGWMRTPISGGRSDNIFLSRRELLSYQKENPTVLGNGLLPFLTTTSREINQPSWSPTINANATFAYKTKRDDTSVANRRFLGVRVTTGFTRRDGSEAKVGDPLVKTRFPLTKIKAFTENNRNDVSLYFGLTPAQQANGKVISWTPDLLNGTVRTLKQVADAKREPNFFELLKAGLLEGSLGNRAAGNSFFADTARDGNINYQILRIGASIIDQWDVDDDPTIIQFGPTNPLTGVRPDDVAGVENLPYFHFLGESRFRRRDGGSGPPNDPRASTFITFQLWNPHKNASEGKVATGTYRIAFAGTSRVEWNTTSSAKEPGYNPYIRNSPDRTANFSTDYISFSPSIAENFSIPIYMKPGKAGATSSKPVDTISQPGGPVIGYNVGEVDAPYTNHGTRYSANGMFSRYSTSMSFALQKNVAGVWVNYQIVPEWTQTHGFTIVSLQDNSAKLYAANGDYVNLHAMFVDPRTTRYGLSTTTEGQTAVNKTAGDRSYNNKWTPPTNWVLNSPGKRPMEYQNNPNTGNPTKVVNRDDKRRPTDAGSPFGLDGSQRPEILNRPFQSVADMGYAFRDDPWTSLNFFGDPEDATNPGDGALLDLFSLTEKSVRAGVVNPNSAPAPVLAALLSKAAIRESGQDNTLSAAKALSYGKAIRAALDANPLINDADIAALAGKITQSDPIPGFKTHKDRQVIARALTDVSNLRTWNLLVDVIAQSGKLSSGASSLANFANQGEKRFWYHIAIDRVTGEIIDVQRENVFE